MGLSTRTLALLHDRLLFIWLQQNLHQDNGLTQVAAILQQESRADVDPVSCQDLTKSVHADHDDDGNTLCYDRNLKFDEKATCTAVSSHAVGGTYGCFVAPGMESLGPNAYVERPPGAPSDFQTSQIPPQFFGSADRSQTDATKARVWYQSCCRPDQDHVLHERALIEEERLRNVKTCVQGLTKMNAKNDIDAKKALALLQGDVDGNCARIILTGKGSDYYVLGDVPHGYPALWPHPASGSPAEFKTPITMFLNDFLQGIANGHYRDAETGFGIGIALQRLLDGAIYERRQITKTLYHQPDENYKSPSKWKTPDYPVTTLGDAEDQDDRKIMLNDGKTPLLNTDGEQVNFPKELPVEVKEGDYVLKDLTDDDGNTVRIQDKNGKRIPVPEGSYLVEEVMTKAGEAEEARRASRYTPAVVFMCPAHLQRQVLACGRKPRRWSNRAAGRKMTNS